MIAIIINNKGIFKYNAIPAIAPPSSNEPVSPMNTCAGYILNNKNPIKAPTNTKQKYKNWKIIFLIC